MAKIDAGKHYLLAIGIWIFWISDSTRFTSEGSPSSGLEAPTWESRTHTYTRHWHANCMIFVILPKLLLPLCGRVTTQPSRYTCSKPSRKACLLSSKHVHDYYLTAKVLGTRCSLTCLVFSPAPRCFKRSMTTFPPSEWPMMASVLADASL